MNAELETRLAEASERLEILAELETLRNAINEIDESAGDCFVDLDFALDALDRLEERFR